MAGQDLQLNECGRNALPLSHPSSRANNSTVLHNSSCLVCRKSCTAQMMTTHSNDWHHCYS